MQVVGKKKDVGIRYCSVPFLKGPRSQMAHCKTNFYQIFTALEVVVHNPSQFSSVIPIC